MTLSELSIGKGCVVTSIDAEGQQRRHLLDLGFIPGTRVVALRRSPSGDPTAFSIRGTTLALRREQARRILIEAESSTATQ